MTERRIETQASRTADITCGCRAVSFLESDPLHKSDDWVAPQLLPRKIQLLVRTRIGRKLLSRLFGPEGIYEWVIARTRYIDEIFTHVRAEGFPQVVLFGAGFDSRSVRFRSELEDSRVFELDAPTTQAMKTGQYRKRGIEVPPNVTLIPINFEKESVAERLGAGGFRKDGKTLVILEGVLQYLAPEAAHATIDTIRGLAGTGSCLVFDYAHASAVRAQGRPSEETRMMKGLSRYGESWQFGLEEAEVEPFLHGHGFRMLDRKGPKELGESYFRAADGVVRARVNGTQSIVKAERL